ncbi:MAG TPA: GlsB/YeaQ/YmgE family stress response membrane protein [Gemmatimonadaceae bacterium]|nr:GlsB/YeaQ/YmgE family stress response membrane protein [Gemmatimonadaceae bacterium]
MPGRNLPGCVVTILLGTAGAFVGGLLSTTLGWGTMDGGLDTRSIALATAGAVLVLLAARFLLSIVRRPPPPGPR